ncbi:hypothetical protein [Microbacterium candidum]|uniref:PilZ domain-containing protein n=1 Tax=Microbacterium candidum TaxID=3041922 RepID=A0ABT7N3S0_9MICO|nr:hypothetical protein [Microbacterium sp. ASV49]MDL9981350.1 hypothetical protein [Microbacterium sp. ASV49]
MLRLIDADELPPQAAYAIPWRVDRSRLPDLEVHNVGTESLLSVVAQMSGDGWARPPTLVPSMHPGARMRFALRSQSEADTARIAVRWRRVDGEEYAWSFVCA